MVWRQFSSNYIKGCLNLRAQISGYTYFYYDKIILRKFSWSLNSIFQKSEQNWRCSKDILLYLSKNGRILDKWQWKLKWKWKAKNRSFFKKRWPLKFKKNCGQWYLKPQIIGKTPLPMISNSSIKFWIRNWKFIGYTQTALKKLSSWR